LEWALLYSFHQSLKTAGYGNGFTNSKANYLQMQHCVAVPAEGLTISGWKSKIAVVADKGGKVWHEALWARC